MHVRFQVAAVLVILALSCGCDTEGGHDTAAPAAMTRDVVFEAKRFENADGAGEWRAVGPGIPAGHMHHGELPEDATPDTLVLVLESMSAGDYPHLVFNDGTYRWDFGWGENKLEGTPLAPENAATAEFGEELFPHLLGTRWEVTWEFRPVFFQCCDGASDSYYGLKPSIIRLRRL